MKRDTVSKMINRISRRESLPLLRGMFVCPEQVKRTKSASIKDVYQVQHEPQVSSGNIERVNNVIKRAANFSYNIEDGLFITAEEGLYLGG
jgi:hypothetical protein